MLSVMTPYDTHRLAMFGGVGGNDGTHDSANRSGTTIATGYLVGNDAANDATGNHCSRIAVMVVMPTDHHAVWTMMPVPVMTLVVMTRVAISVTMTLVPLPVGARTMAAIGSVMRPMTVVFAIVLAMDASLNVYRAATIVLVVALDLVAASAVVAVFSGVRHGTHGADDECGGNCSVGQNFHGSISFIRARLGGNFSRTRQG
jgi:lysylphosphatidylglycerol synthetase-like protein (DUF2156 family)